MPEGLEEVIVDKSITPVYIYIVCDVVPKIEEFADLAGLAISPDKQGYFGYNSKYNAYIEIKSFKKIIDDAKMRNQIFFKKLGLLWHGCVSRTFSGYNEIILPSKIAINWEEFIIFVM